MLGCRAVRRCLIAGALDDRRVPRMIVDTPRAGATRLRTEHTLVPMSGLMVGRG